LVLAIAQAACVALPAAGVPGWADRYRGRGWVLILPLSIAIVIGGIAVLPSAADVLTWVAMVLVPLSAALALGWAGRGARPWMAVLAAPLLAVAWADQQSRAGQVATILLIAGSATTAARLLSGAAPLTLLKLGVVVMAVVDATLVFSNELQQPNNVLVLASPGLGLPRLQSAAFGGFGMGYGDFFAGAMVGAIFAAQRTPQLAAAAAVVVASLAWDQLFLVYNVLPATVPPTLILVGVEVWRRARRPTLSLDTHITDWLSSRAGARDPGRPCRADSPADP
jgi:hypothetical protein